MRPSLKETILNSLNKSEVSSTKEVSAILKKKNGHSNLGVIDFSTIWNWEDFNLKETTKINENTKALIKEDLAKKRFLEAYYIEKAGMTFAAKMSILSESVDEQRLFSHFAAEEATHFDYIDQLLENVDKNNGKDSFISFLNEVIASGQRRPLIFIIQVVLEGWGIDHYGIMERSCKHSEIKQHLKNILKDEAAHHGSGVSLFNEKDLTDSEIAYTVEMMSEFIKMVRVGPISQHETLAKFAPQINHEEFHELSNAVIETQRKLDYLKALMLKSGAKAVPEKLDSLFVPELLV